MHTNFFNLLSPQKAFPMKISPMLSNRKTLEVTPLTSNMALVKKILVGWYVYFKDYNAIAKYDGGNSYSVILNF